MVKWETVNEQPKAQGEYDEKKEKASYILGKPGYGTFSGDCCCFMPVSYFTYNFASFSDPLRLVQHTGLLFKPLGFTLKGYDVALSYKRNIYRLYEYGCNSMYMVL